MSTDEKRVMSPDCFEQVCKVTTASAFVGREFRGLFWPDWIFKETKGEDIPDGQIDSYKGRRGTIRPRIPGEFVPIGVIELYNDDTETVSNEKIVDKKANNMIEGAFDKNCDNLMANVKQSSRTKWIFSQASSQLAPLILSAEEQAKQQAAEKASQTKARQLKRCGSNSDDDWFTAGSSVAKSKSVRVAGNSNKSAVFAAKPAPVKAPKLSIGESGTTGSFGWRQKANAQRKISGVRVQIECAATLVDSIKTKAGYEAVKISDFEGMMQKFTTYMMDDNFCMCVNKAGILEPTSQTVEVRQDVCEKLEHLTVVSQVVKKLRAGGLTEDDIQELLEAIANLVTAGFSLEPHLKVDVMVVQIEHVLHNKNMNLFPKLWSMASEDVTAVKEFFNNSEGVVTMATFGEFVEVMGHK